VALGAVYGAGQAFFSPAFDAIVPEVLPPDELAQANALDQFVRAIVGLLPLSFALTGPVTGAIGAQATLIGAGLIGGAVTFGALLLPGMRALEDRAGEDDQHDDRRDDGDHPDERPEGLLLGAQRVEHRAA
jgi:DHA3 family tetracycline resistance protein-like MFS transporter